MSFGGKILEVGLIMRKQFELLPDIGQISEFEKLKFSIFVKDLISLPLFEQEKFNFTAGIISNFRY